MCMHVSPLGPRKGVTVAFIHGGPPHRHGQRPQRAKRWLPWETEAEILGVAEIFQVSKGEPH